ncbi:MAG: UMP kinase [Rickettsiales bacterium]|nr:UMP kinase [Rickettsiales bacterium]
MIKNKKHKRVLLKISGEVLQGDAQFGQDLPTLEYVSKEIASLVKNNIQACLVVGAGNFIRGKQFMDEKLINHTTADYMGMLATVMNALALQCALTTMGFKVKIFSSIPMHTVCEPYSYNKALQALNENYIVIFAGGTGNPCVTTDTISVTKAIEMQCDMLLKGTHVDGVYNKDPKENKDAKIYKKISYDEILSNNLEIMDLPAIYIAKKYNLPILVFNLHEEGNLIETIKNGTTKSGNFSLIS